MGLQWSFLLLHHLLELGCDVRVFPGTFYLLLYNLEDSSEVGRQRGLLCFPNRSLLTPLNGGSSALGLGQVGEDLFDLLVIDLAAFLGGLMGLFNLAGFTRSFLGSVGGC